MEATHNQIRDQQKASWDKFSSGWKKWDEIIMDFLKSTGDEMIRQLKLNDSDLVLDIASGTGEPAFSIAQIVKNGKVTLTDLSDKMLDVARQNAEKRGISNVDFIACDVSALPFPDQSFDAISCRYGFMFFPDMQLAANEMFRVLKPGGRMVTAVWDGPEKNFWITAMGGTINRNMGLTEPAQDAPGMFRCAQPGLMEGIFKKAGFQNPFTIPVNGKLQCETAETYWNIITEVSAPFVAALSQADENLRSKIRAEVIEVVNQKYPDGNVSLDGNSLIICGEK